MRPLQDDVQDEMINDIYSPATQADAVMNTQVSGINDASYNPFPASSSYMQGGFAPTPTYEQVPLVDDQIYTPQPINTPISPAPPQWSGKCVRVIFTANRGYSAQAYWTDCSGVQRGQFVSVNETLEVDALDGTASGLPYMSYPIGHAPIPPAFEPPAPVLEQPEPYKPPYEPVPLPPYVPVEPSPLPPAPIDPIFLMPQPAKCYNFSLTNVSNQVYNVGFTDCCTGEAVNFALSAGETVNNLQYETTNFNTSDLVASNIIEGCIPKVVAPTPQSPQPVTPAPVPAPTPVTPAAPAAPTPVDAIKSGVMPPDNVGIEVVAPVPVVTPITQTVTPETLPTKAVSKDLKPYIIAGIGIVAILIASRLLSKK